jgi:hypothetical protein
MKLIGVDQMNKSKRSKFTVLLLMTLFFGIVLVPTASATPERPATEKEGNEPKSVDNSQWVEWKQAHTVEVEVTTVYDYKKDGMLKITETYSGEKLESKFKVDKLTRSQTFSVSNEEIAISAKSGGLKLSPGDKKEFVTRESIVLTTADDPYRWWDNTSSTTSSTVSLTASSASLAYPQWTFSKVVSLFKTYYKMEDPINLVWEQNSLKAVKSTILNQKWVDNPVEYTHYLPYPDGSWVAGTE